ncbi:Ankrd17 [Symbiodinium sp. KB8]|nr:Ankrd17 [Symbiodinium sp. KB8]
MIRVMKLSGDEVASVQLNDLAPETVRSLKHHLHHLLGIPLCMQSLVTCTGPLDDAAMLEGLGDVQLVLRRATTAASQWEFAEALLGACSDGNVEEARSLLEAGADVNSIEENSVARLGQTPLIRACKRGHVEVVRLLLGAGAKKEKECIGGYTALMWACYHGHFEVGRLLVEAGADLNSTGDNGFTALSQACTRGRLEVARWLLEAGADVNQLDADGLTVLARACKGGHVEVASMLLEAGADVDRFDIDGRTALIRACEKGQLGAARILLGARADVNRTADAYDVTPLIAACRGDHVELSHMLLQAGANKDSQSTALMGASERGNIKITGVLLEAAAKQDLQGCDGHTALMSACYVGHLEAATLATPTFWKHAYDSFLGIRAFLCGLSVQAARRCEAAEDGRRMRSMYAGTYGGSPASLGTLGPRREYTSASGGLAAPSYSGTFGARFSSKLTPQEKEIIDVAFESFKDESGYITTERLKEAFEAIDQLGDISDIQMLLDSIDQDGDGKIDEDEFRHIMTRKFLGEDDDASFVHAFEMLDVNKDGYIPLADLRSVLMKEGSQPLSEQEVDELMMFADIEGDGLIEYKSFLRWLSNPDAVR